MLVRWRVRIWILSILFALALSGVPSFADWTAMVTPPSTMPWMYDFGTGWMTVDVDGGAQGLLLLVKKVPSDQEQKLMSLLKTRGATVSGFTGFQAFRPSATKEKLIEISDFSQIHAAIVFTLHFRTMPKVIVLAPDQGTDPLIITPSNESQAINRGGFNVELSAPMKYTDTPTFVLTVNKWPPGDPKMGN